MTKGKCSCGNDRLENGNCSHCAVDGYPVQSVGPWAKEKHDYLARYIGATWAARDRYVTPSPKYPIPGGAAYIDLFAGPGRSKIDTTGEIIDGSPLVAASHDRAPFSKLIICEKDPANVAALEACLAAHRDRVVIIPGDCIANIDDVIRNTPPNGLNLALIDPFGPAGLRWSVLEKLDRVKRMDLLINFPTGPIKRNFGRLSFDEMVGTTEWRKDVRTEHDVHRLVDHLRRGLERLGYTGGRIQSAEIRNSMGTIIYHLVFAAKNGLADNIWASILKVDARGQRSLF